MINDFYTALKIRNDKLLQNLSRNDELKKLNEHCVYRATTAYTEINWRNFHKLDLILLIPSVIFGSLFITYICERIPMFLFFGQHPSSLYEALYFVTSVTARGVGSFFVIRMIFRYTQGIIINTYALPSVFRSFAFLTSSFVIVGIPAIVVLFVIFEFAQQPTYLINDIFNVSVIVVITDIGRMFLLTWVISKRYMKRNIKIHNHLSRWQRVKFGHSPN
jgi:hypothetical protein